MLKKTVLWLLFAFAVYFIVRAPTESGRVLTTVGETAAAGFDSAADWLIGFMRDHEFMQGG